MTFEKFIDKKADPNKARVTGEVLNKDLPRSGSTERHDKEREAFEGVIVETDPEKRERMVSVLESLVNQIGALPGELNDLDPEQKATAQNIVVEYLGALERTDTNRMIQLRKDLQRVLG